MKLRIILIVIIGTMLSSNAAYGAQLEAEILSSESELQPSFKFLRVVYVENLEDGELEEMFSSNMVKFSADSSNSDLSELISQINDSIKKSGSKAIVTDVKLNYQTIISKQKNSVTMEYNVVITPTITNHIGIDGASVIVDSKWRGFQIDEPIFVETQQYGLFDVNDPLSALKVALPNAYSELKDVDVLSIPLVDASGILDLPMSKWHYLFDPTAIQASGQDYGYKGSLTSEYSMGECTIAIGVCNDREWSNTVTIDKEYIIRAIESQDDAVISVEGYTAIYHGTEAIAVTLERADILEEKGGFQTSVIYGMATISAVAGGMFFLYSNKKIKNEKDMGQTGIDPARLQVQETSYSAGGYKTNRGESYLASDLSSVTEQKQSRTPI